MKLSFSPYFTAYDTGAGAGGAGSESLSSSDRGAGPGAGTGDRGTGDRGAGGGGRGTGGGTPYKLSDDSMVDLGDGKPVSWKEARSSRFVPKEDHDRFVSTFNSTRPMLESYAKQLDEGFARLRQLEAKAKQGGAEGMQARKDIADELESLPVLDGAAGARMIRELRAQGLAPIAQQLMAQAGQIKQLTDRLSQMGGTTGVLADRYQNQEFESHVTENLKELGEVKGIGTIDTNNPIVRELAKDLWGAYDAKTWTVPEYRRMLKERIEGFVTLVLESQKKQIEVAKDKKRAFFNPAKGGGQGSGDRQYRHLSGLELARESGMFDRQSA